MTMMFSTRLVPNVCTVQDVSGISIGVILKHFDKFRASLTYRNRLQQQCHTILVESHVKSGCTISPSKSKLAAAYGITDIVILNIKVNGKNNNEEHCRVTHKTNISIEYVQSTDYFHLSSAQEVIRLGGLDHELRQLTTLLKFNKIQGLPPTQRTVGVLLHGPPGCGKTCLGKALSYSCNAAFINVEASDILKAEVSAGAEALSKIFAKAVSLSAEGPVVLFLDDLDTLCPQLTTASLGNRLLTSALISEMDKLHGSCIPGLLVVAATNAISSINPAIRRPGRFDREVLVNIPSQQQRLAILKMLTETMTLHCEDSLTDLAKMTTGYVGADLLALCEEAHNQAFNRQASTGRSDNLRVQMCDFTAALHKVSPSLKKGLTCHVDLQPVLWSDIGGLDDVKAEIQQSIEWPLLHPESLRLMDLAATKGVLLFGPPGCCKTTLVRAAATSCHVTFLTLSGAQVYSPYVGESERIVSEAFQKARALSPCILFFDEIDSLVGKRSSGGSQSRVQERILSTMLNEMDGIGTRLDMKTHALREGNGDMERAGVGAKNADSVAKTFSSNNAGPQSVTADCISKVSDVDMSRVIVIGATNRPDMLDPAILRPGRLDRHIYVPPPDAEGRKSILNIQVSKMATVDLNIDYIADHTELFSGADLKNLCREAALTAVRESSAQGKLDANSLLVRQHHFVSALGIVKPSLSHTVLQQYSSKHRIS